MTIVGWHASHEQIAPSRLLAAVRHAEAGGFRRGDVVGPLRAVERAPGRVRVRLVVARRGDGDDRLAVRRRQRSGPALPPGDHRPGHGDARRDVPRSPVGRARAPASSPTSTSPAQPWPDKATRNRRLEECVGVMRALFAGEEVTHDGLVASIEPACGRCRPHRRRCSPRRCRRRRPGGRRDGPTA